MSDDPETLRGYGLAENRHVFASILNPATPLHDRLDILEDETVQACDQAMRAFGAGDPIHLDARLNAALLFAHRMADPGRARAHLDAAETAASASAGLDPALSAKLVTMRCLVAQLSGGRVSDGLDADAARWLGLGDEDAPGVFRTLAATVAASGDPVLPWLLWRIAGPFAYERLADGDRTGAAALLRGAIRENAVGTWGAESHRVARLEAEIGWLREAETGTRDAGRLGARAASRAAALDTEAAGPHGLRDGIQDVRAGLERVARASGPAIARAVEGCEDALRRLFDALEADGHYDAILDWTDAFAEAAAECLEERMGDAAPSEVVPADARDALDAAAAGDVLEAPLQAMLPGQACISREHLTWTTLGVGAPEPIGHVARGVLVPALEALAELYDVAPRADRRAQSVALRALALRVSHGVQGEADAVHGQRVRLAQALFDHAPGDMGDVANAVLTHTDGLDFSEAADPADVSLGKGLRATAFWLRASTSQTVAPWPLEDGEALMDFAMAGAFAREAADGLRSESQAAERAWLGYAQADALLTKGAGSFAREAEGTGADGMLASCLVDLEAADIAFGPVAFPERWLDVQMLKVRALGALSARGADLPETPVEVLRRARGLLAHVGPGLLRLRLDAACLATGAGGPALLSVPEADGADPGHTGRYDLHALAEIMARARGLFTARDFDGAAPLLEAAASLGRIVFARGGSAKVLRVAAHQIGEATRRLSYCHLRAGDPTRAALTLEDGKALMLRSALEPELIDWAGVAPDMRARAEALIAERETLLARSESAIAFVEDIDRLGVIPAELDALIGDRIAALRAPSTFGALAVAPRGSVLAMPLVTEHGSAVFMIRGDATALTAADVVTLPDLGTDDLRRWLGGDAGRGWLNAYEGRVRSRIGRHRFRAAIVDMARRMHRDLIGPIRDKARADGHAGLILVPTSGLQVLPLQAAAPDDPAEGGTLLDAMSVRTVPSATILGLLERRAARAGSGRSLVAGVAEYDHPSWGDLENARSEARIVAAELGVTPLLDAAATPDALAERTDGAPFVHVACHGSSWATDPTFFSGFQPRPVLILRSAGVSTAAIQSGWTLRGTRLVCLSGCDTGLIDLHKPWDEFEGVSSLLLGRGAKAVLASLWSVDDRSTALLMSRFYRNVIGDGMAPAEALRAAQLWLRSARPGELRAAVPASFADVPPRPDDAPPPFAHPFYWAAFVLTG